MSAQPEALRLADYMENNPHWHDASEWEKEAAAELRRLLFEALKIEALHAQAQRELFAARQLNRELLEALKSFVDFPEDTFDGVEDFPFTMSVRMNLMRQARAAIAKGEQA